MGFFSSFLPSSFGTWLIIQKWLEIARNDPCVLPKDKEENNQSTDPWLLVLIMHFNEGWIIELPLVGVRERRICVRVRAFWERTKVAAVPACVVVFCSTSGQTDVIYLAFPTQEPLYLTGKVKAHSPEAIPQRSSGSLGMRDGGEKRMKTRFCSSSYRGLT